MPEVSRFDGIMVRFYYRDHPLTHFHAMYGEHEALIEIETGTIHQGSLPNTAYDLVNRWRTTFICKNSATTGTGRASTFHFCRSLPSNNPGCTTL